MPILQDLIFGDYLARKRREHNAALLDSQRPDVEFKAGVERETNKAAQTLRTEEAVRLARLMAAQERLNKGEGVAADIALINQHSSNPVFGQTDFGAQTARNRELSTGSNTKAEFNSGYGETAKSRGAAQGRLESLDSVNRYNEGLGQWDLAYDVGRSGAESKIANSKASRDLAFGVSEVAPGKAAREKAENAEATTTAPEAGKVAREKLAAELRAAQLGTMINTDRLNGVPDIISADRNKRTLDNILLSSDVRTANRLFDPETGSPIDAAIQLGGGRIPQGAAIPGVNYPSPSEDIKMVKDPLTGIEKPMAVREAGKPVPTLGRRLIVPGTNPDRPPIGVGKLPDDGNQPPPPAIDSSPKVVKKSADLSNISLEDWKNFAYKSYKIKPDKGVFVDKDPIPTLLRLMDKELSTGVDAVTGQPLAPETVQEISNQRKAILKLVSR